MTDEFKFAVGGTVQAAQGTYLSRPVDSDLFEACKRGEYAHVLASRQIGKSSLMTEIARKLSNDGVKTAILDLNRIGSDPKTMSAEQWYFTFIELLASRLGLDDVDMTMWWERHLHQTNSGRFVAFLEKVVLAQIEDPIVIFVDEIDSTIPLAFTDDFFTAIRSIYNSRPSNQELRRITFVLLGVATPGDLIKDKSQTPYNIGQEIAIRDFEKEECQPLRQTLKKVDTKRGAQCFDQVYTWTNGHPYLTQHVCRMMFDQLTGEQDSNGIPENGAVLVDTLINNQFLAAEDLTDNNLQFVEDAVLRDQHADRMLEIYRQILEGSPVADIDHSVPISRLKLYGLVVTKNGHLHVRNKLYEQMFDTNWVENRLNNTRLGIPDKYKILKQLGHRGHVKIYLAQRQDIAPSPSVLIKVLDVSKEAGIKWTEWFTRLKTEVMAVQRSKHENIVPIIDFGGVDKETLYIVLDYIDGGDLNLKLKEKGAISKVQALDWVSQIASSLIHMHKQQIFHLNVTPRDILFDTRQTFEKPMLTDFGFANFGLNESPLDVHLDYIEVTKEYVAPEILQHNTPSMAADVYSLAVTLFEMLAGQLPEDRVPGTPLGPLSALVPDIGDYLDSVLTQATANQPEERYQSIDAFLEAITKAQHQAAIDKIESARIYMSSGTYKTQTALMLLAEAFEIDPDNIEALQLRGAVCLKEEKFEDALTDYRRAFEVEQADINSSAGQVYLQALKDVADATWQDEDQTKAIEYYREIKDSLSNVYDASMELKRYANSRLIEYYRAEGNKAYQDGDVERITETLGVLEELEAQSDIADLTNKLNQLEIKNLYQAGIDAFAKGEPKDILKAIETLKVSLEQLQTHNAETEREELTTHLNRLKIKYRTSVIVESRQQIEDIKATETRDERVFQLYDTLDIIYRELEQLDSYNPQWADDHQKTLIEQAKWRFDFAQHNEDQHYYAAALNHYQAIRSIEENKGTGSLDQTLGIALTAKLEELKKKVNFDEKYEKILALMHQQEYSNALTKLEQDFIKPGIYSHRDVTYLLWQLVECGKQGKLPLGKHPTPAPTGPKGDLVPELRKQIEDLQGNLDGKDAVIKTLQEQLAAQPDLQAVPIQGSQSGYNVELQQAKNTIKGLNSKLDRLYQLLYLGWGVAAASLIGFIAYIMFLTQ